MKAFALDGHDGTGKTTLARALARSVGARYVRPFGGEAGRRLIEAYEAGRHQDTLSIGRSAILSQFAAARGQEPLVFDRGWVTVATLIPREVFAAAWDVWIPSALLWCDQAETRKRLQARGGEEAEPDDRLAYFLAAYLDRFSLQPGEVVRTDILTQADALETLVRCFEDAPSFELRTIAV